MADNAPQAAPAPQPQKRKLLTNHTPVSSIVFANAVLGLAASIASRFGYTPTPAELGYASVIVSGIVGYLVPGV